MFTSATATQGLQARAEFGLRTGETAATRRRLWATPTTPSPEQAEGSARYARSTSLRAGACAAAVTEAYLTDTMQAAAAAAAAAEHRNDFSDAGR